ncbi:hypothetical protein, partial [Klebsiella pneumoniae]|uniref:hypothetical protein n=1 Tax=Klebsiella pneumoniae TaxID=573 RepID=UPI002FF179BF
MPFIMPLLTDYPSNQSAISLCCKMQSRFPRTLNLNFIKKQDMRYGENSHQQAAFYIEENVKE